MTGKKALMSTDYISFVCMFKLLLTDFACCIMKKL